MIDENKLQNLKQSKFNKLFDFLDINFLKKNLFEYGRNEPKTSKYYIGKRLGTFYNGFTRLEKVPNIKIKSFYREEIKHHNEKVIYIIEDAIFHILNLKRTDYDLEKLKVSILNVDDVDLISILSELFDINCNLTINQFISIKKDFLEKYRVDSAQIKKEYNEEIRTLEVNLSEQKEINSKLLNQLENIEKAEDLIKVENEENIKKLEQLQNNIDFFKNKLMQNIIEYDDIYKYMIQFIENYDIQKADHIRDRFIVLLENNIEKFKNNENICNDLVIQFILINIMEELKNGNTTSY